MSEESQCLPLMECEDIHPQFKVRCPWDGTCKSRWAQCKKLDVLIKEGLNQKCPLHIPYMCSTGQCAVDPSHCLQSVNGCELRRPTRCPFSGLCVKNITECSNWPVEY